MTKIDYLRGLDFLNPEVEGKNKITIIGVGATGSFISLALGKMGFSDITVFDHDSVEIHNIPNQFYPLEAVGVRKVDALASVMSQFTGMTPKTNATRWQNGQVSEIVISAVDSMACRKEIWEKCKYNLNVKAFINPRMGGEVMKLYVVNPCNPADIELYEKHLHTDANSSRVACTAQTIIYNVLVISGFVAAHVKKVVKNEPYEREIIFDLSSMCMLKDSDNKVEA